MGESRGGGGQAAGLPVISAVSDLVRLFNSGERELGFLNISRTTEGIYSLNVGEHGQDAWETIYFSTEDNEH